MGSARIRRFSQRVGAIAIAVLLLAGCSGPVPMELSAAGAGVAPARNLSWASVPEDMQLSPSQRAARDALVGALTKQGFRVGDNAALTMDMGLSQRPAAIAVVAGKGALSPAKKMKLLQRCADRTIRLSLQIVDSASGAPLFSGAAQEAHCHATLKEVLPRLADALAGELSAPNGEHVLYSHARD